MRKSVAVTLAVGLLAVLASPASAKPFANCAALQKMYKYGIAQSAKAVATAKGSVFTPRVNAKLYLENRRLDRDADGIVCEVSRPAPMPSKPAPAPASNAATGDFGGWTLGPVVLDSEIVRFTPVDVEPIVIGGKVRIYVERFGTRGIVSFTSSDGVTFTQDPGVRLESGAFPSVVEIADGRYRMYYADGPSIFSAVSSDGLTWTREDGVRAAGREPTVAKLRDGRWLMALRVESTDAPSTMSCNKDVSHVDFLISSDGLTFTRTGRVIDSLKHPDLNGRAYGVEFARLANGDLTLMYEGCLPLFFAKVDEAALTLGPGTAVTNLRGKVVADHYGGQAEIGGSGGDHGFVIFNGQERTYFAIRSAGGSRERIATATR